MIKYLFISFVILTCLNITITAQISPGARHAALSYSDVAEESDIFSLFNNPSGIAKINCRQIGLFYSPFPYGLKELATGYFIYNEPFSFGNIAIGAMRYGFDLYRENRFSIGYADSISKYLLLGISGFYHFVKIKGYGSSGIYNLSLGSQFVLNNFLRLGFSVHNPIRYSNDKIELPLFFRMGIAYTPLKDSFIYCALMKELEFPFSLRFGIEYPFAEFFDFRLGTQNNPNVYSAGFGIEYSLFQFNYSLQSHIDLGLTHQADIVLTLNR